MASSSGGPNASTIVLIGVGAAAAVCSFFLIKHMTSDAQEAETETKQESKPKKRTEINGTATRASVASSPAPAPLPLVPESKAVLDEAEKQRADRERRKREADLALAEALERRREEERAEAERRAAVAKRDEEMKEKMRLKRQEEEARRKAMEEEAKRKAAEEAAERQRLHELERELLRKREAEEKRAQEETEARKEEAERRRLHDRERLLLEQQRVLAQTQGDTEVPVSSESLMNEADEAAIREAQERSEAEERALSRNAPAKVAAINGTPKKSPVNGPTVLTNGYLHNLSDDESDSLSPLSPTGLNGSVANHRDGTMGSALFPHPNGSVIIPSDSTARPRSGSGSALQSSTTSFLPPLMRSASLPEDSASLRKSSITFSEDEFPDLSQTRVVASQSGGDAASPQSVAEPVAATPVKEAKNFWSKNPLTRSPSSTSSVASGPPPPLRRATTAMPRSASMGQQAKRPMPSPLVDSGRSPLKASVPEPVPNGQSVLSLSSSLSSSADPTPAPVVERPVRGPLRRSFTVSNTANLPGSSSMSGSISLISHSAADSAT